MPPGLWGSSWSPSEWKQWFDCGTCCKNRSCLKLQPFQPYVRSRLQCPCELINVFHLPLNFLHSYLHFCSFFPFWLGTLIKTLGPLLSDHWDASGFLWITQNWESEASKSMPITCVECGLWTKQFLFLFLKSAEQWYTALCVWWCFFVVFCFVLSGYGGSNKLKNKARKKTQIRKTKTKQPQSTNNWANIPKSQHCIGADLNYVNHLLTCLLGF